MYIAIGKILAAGFTHVVLLSSKGAMEKHFSPWRGTHISRRMSHQLSDNESAKVHLRRSIDAG